MNGADKKKGIHPNRFLSNPARAAWAIYRLPLGRGIRLVSAGALSKVGGGAPKKILLIIYHSNDNELKQLKIRNKITKGAKIFIS